MSTRPPLANWPLSGSMAPAPRRRIAPATILDVAAKLAIVGLFLIGVTVALDATASIALPVTAALVIALLVGPLGGKLERRGLPPAVVGLLVILSVIALLVVIGIAFALPVSDWIRRAPELWASLQSKLLQFQATLFRLREMSESIEEITNTSRETAETVVLRDGGLLSSAAWTAPSLIGQFALFLVALFFFVATRTQMRASILSLCFARRSRLTAARIMRDAERQVSAYLGLITLINIGLGVVVGVAMWILGMPNPAVWGALAAILNYAQYLGPIVMVVILAAVGLGTFETVGAGLLPAAVFFGINAVEGQFVTPAVLGRRFTVNPLLILLSLSFWLWLWGPVGALLAVPLLMISTVFVTHLVLPQFAAEDAAQRRRERREKLRQGHVSISTVKPIGAVAVPHQPPEMR